jgi:hypothetical protein
VAHGTVISLYAAATCGAPGFETWDALDPLPAYLAIALPAHLEIPPTGFASR